MAEQSTIPESVVEDIDQQLSQQAQPLLSSWIVERQENDTFLFISADLKSDIDDLITVAKLIRKIMVQYSRRPLPPTLGRPHYAIRARSCTW